MYTYSNPDQGKVVSPYVCINNSKAVKRKTFHQINLSRKLVRVGLGEQQTKYVVHQKLNGVSKRYRIEIIYYYEN